jgi:indolepyruvate ferredoxin oxidoreductase
LCCFHKPRENNVTSTLDHAGPARPDVIGNRFSTDGGQALLTGVQAIGRLLVEIHERERRAGRDIGVLVSGYPGSPLGGLDQTIARMPEAAARGIKLVPGLNEELAMTSIWGSQIEPQGRARSVDGVVGVWFGKAPGLDRCTDALRHGNLLGAHPDGGALLMVGDDPACKSSTIPSASESLLAALGVPVFYPRNGTEIVRMGIQALELSRASGCFVALKVVAEVADGFSSIVPGLGELDVTVPHAEWDGKPWHYQQRTVPAPPGNVAAEGELHGPRLELARRFAASNAVNEVLHSRAADRIGLVAPGRTYDELVEALGALGLTDAALDASPIRLLRVGMPFPLEPGVVAEFAAGLDTVLVLEEKGTFLESQVRDLLYGGPSMPPVLGKRDATGRPLVPSFGELTATTLGGPLRRVLGDLVSPPATENVRRLLDITPVRRTPFFCSGCPHNRSTAAPEGSIVGGGIGCHSMVALIDRPSSAAESITQMGGEGAQFIGQAPFLAARPHLIQNLGDGTLYHSGQLAIQACVAAGVNVTFKVLFNHVIAMTGGQGSAGSRDVPSLTRKFEAEGVVQTIVVAREPKSYGRRPRWAANVTVWGRDRLDEAQRTLQAVDGVTVLIYDQECAAEVRRLRKRGKRATPTTRIVINDRVCEGCGDCGEKSNCLSVQPVETAFGRKTTIDQTSCNFDYSCTDGDCPSFVEIEVVPGAGAKEVAPPRVADPELPTVPADSSYNIFLAGVGGTGIVTVNQVLAAAAMSDGLASRGVDQTGLSQKAGPVTSHLRLGRDQAAMANRPGPGEVDCYLAFDVLVGSDPAYLQFIGPERSRTVVSSSLTPTGSMVTNPELSRGVDGAGLARSIEDLGSGHSSVYVDAVHASDTLFGEETFANILLLGAAFQAGALPVSAAAIEWAIGQNGVAVDTNVAAFRWGRAAVAERAAFDAATATQVAKERKNPTADRARRLVEATSLPTDVQSTVVTLTADLIDFQSEKLAREFLDLVVQADLAERSSGHADEGLALAVAAGYHHFLAYKDEYEVARLLTDPEFTDRIAREFPGSGRVKFLLHPPVLRAAGRSKKIRIDARMSWALRGLAGMRGLRGTAFDPFGRTHMRRLERHLAAHYRVLVEGLLHGLLDDGGGPSHSRSLEVAQAAQLVRGYEEVKIAGVERYAARLVELGATPPVDGEGQLVGV